MLIEAEYLRAINSVELDAHVVFLHEMQAGKNSLAFIGAAFLFLPLFVFLPKLILRAMKADVDAAIETFGKNEHTQKVFWTMFVSMAGFVLARVLDPATAQQVVGVITGMGM